MIEEGLLGHAACSEAQDLCHEHVSLVILVLRSASELLMWVLSWADSTAGRCHV